MIGGLQFSLLISLLSAAQGDLLNVNDAQTCMDLCASCEGTSMFEDGVCECLVPEDNKLGIECVKRIKREIENIDLDYASSDLGNAERSARCSLLGARRRLHSADADRVVNYFMNGGPLTGSPLLGKSNPDCSSSSKDQITAASNPNTERPVEPVVKPKIESPVPKSPVVGAASSPACANAQYQPIVSSTQWLPNYGMGYSPMIGAHQPFQGGYHPQYPYGLLGSIPHMILGIPHTLTTATHIPAYHHQPGLLGATQHSPLVSALASRTHGILQHLDNVVAPYSNQHNHGNIVGAARTADVPCAQSSYPSSNILGAASPVHSVNPVVLQQVLAHQNSLLEALSNQLGSYSSQVGAPRVQYTPSQYNVGAPNPVGQYYCPDNGSSPTLGAAHPNAAESPPKSAESSPKSAETSAKLPETLKAANPKSSSKDSTTEDEKKSSDDLEEANDAKKEAKESDDDKAKEPANAEETAEEKTEEKIKRETRSRSSARRKRGDVKYTSKKLTQ